MIRRSLILLLGLIACIGGGCYRGHSARVDRPSIVSARQWGSTPDAMPAQARHYPTRITVHHAGVVWKADDDPIRKLTGLQTWGRRERNWPDLPYHYLIAPDGRIFEGRSTDFAPETNTAYDPRGHLGVQLWGSFSEQRVSREQLRATAHLIAWLCDRHMIPPSTILGHSDVAPGTQCPGSDLHRYISEGDLQVWVAEIIAGREPDIDVKDPLPDGPVEWIPTLFSAGEVP